MALEKFKSYLHLARFIIQTDNKSLMWLFRQHGDKGRLSRWGLMMSQWNVVAVPNKEQAGLYKRSLSHEAGSKMHAPDCGSRMFDTNDGGQLPPEGREDIILHIAQTTSMSPRWRVYGSGEPNVCECPGLWKYQKWHPR